MTSIALHVTGNNWLGILTPRVCHNSGECLVQEGMPFLKNTVYAPDDRRLLKLTKIHKVLKLKNVADHVQTTLLPI